MKVNFIKSVFFWFLVLVFSFTNTVLAVNKTSNLEDILFKNWYNYLNSNKIDRKVVLDKQFNKSNKYDLNSTWNKKTLINSIKNDKLKSFKLILRTDLPESELKETFSFFDDNISIKKQSDSIFELNIPFNSSIAKSFLNWVDNWILPANVLNFDIFEPEYIQIATSASYLSWENLVNIWWIKKIWADKYQEWLKNKQKIKIWILDTWIDYNHIDLRDNYNSILSYDFVNRDGDPVDDNGHGTHVSWIAWWVVNAWWIFWVNSNSSLVWLKVLDNNWWGSSYNIWEAIRYAADNWIKVINMSLGGRWTPSTSYLCSSIDYAFSKWTISVVAAWNSNANVSKFVPAWCPNAITVWAVDNTLTRAYFSNFWSLVDVSAPWVWIYSSVPWNLYATWNWTSMASPFIAWLVSAIFANKSAITLSEIENYLKNPSFTDNVITSSTKKIWRFANMAKIMFNMNILNDDWIY